MQLEKLFKVLVLGSAALAVGCEGEAPPSQRGDTIGPPVEPVDPVEKPEQVSGGRREVPGGKKGTGVVLVDGGAADGGVSSWLHWF